MAERLDGIVLREMRMRPIWDAAERASWDGPMEAHHYLGFHSPFGMALRHSGGAAGRGVGGAARLVARSVQGQGAGALAELAAGAAIPAAAPDSQQHAVSGFAGIPGSEPSVACFGSIGAAPVVGHGGAVGTSGFFGGDLCGPGPVGGDLPPGSGLDGEERRGASARMRAASGSMAVQRKVLAHPMRPDAAKALGGVAPRAGAGRLPWTARRPRSERKGRAQSGC